VRSAPLLRQPGARGIDEDLPHGPRGQRKEMCSVLPVDTPGVNEAQVGFVDERGGLQVVARRLLAHPGVGNLAEFSVDERRQARKRTIVASPPGPQQLCDLRRGR